jgi:predicted site-specific integrase-resolvase
MELERFVPIEELAKHFSVSISTVRGWLRQGYIPKDTYLKIGNTYRFNLPKVVEALTANNTPKKQRDSSSPKKDEQQLEFDFTNPDEDA